MIELLVPVAWTCIFKPILEDLAKDSAKDFAKDFCTDALKSVLGGRDEWKKATAKAFKEFLEQFEQELIGAGETESSVKTYIEPLRYFTDLAAIREILGAAITDPDSVVNAASLANLWAEQKLIRLPDDFDWSKLSRRYQNKARGILRESQELRTILDSCQQQKIVDATERIAGIAPGFDTSKYAEGLKKRYGYLKLESLDANPDHQRIALTKIFIEQTVRSCQQFNPRVYELPIERRRRLPDRAGPTRELSDEEITRQRESFLAQTPKPVLEVVDDPTQRLCVILGDPGAGKSALLNYLAMRWAEQPPVERTSRPLPILIELKTYMENLAKGICRDFLEYADHGSGAVGHLEMKSLDGLFHHGQATLLVDGLDEIFDPPTRQQVAQDIVRFSIRYPARIIVTSRSIGYDLVAPTLRDGGFQHHLLQELDEPQQLRFIADWHQLAYADTVDRASKIARLRDSIENVPAIGELARNPLLLTLMALLNRHQELPRDRNELYEQASKLMLQQWDATKALQDDSLLRQQSFDYKDKQAMLRAIAFRMQTNPGGLSGNVIAEDELEQTLVVYLQSLGHPDPRTIAIRMIQQLRERNFILCLLGDEYFAFVHRTFLEFFCAWAWVWKFEKEKSLTFEELQSLTFNSHWQDEHWQEVLRLIAARLEPSFAGKVIEGLLLTEDPSYRFRPVFLAANCYADIRNPVVVGSATEALQRKLLTLTHFAPPESFRLNNYELQQITTEVHEKSVHAYVACFPRAPAIRDWLNDRVRNDEYGDVRCAAVEALARGWKDDPGTRPLLIDRAYNDEDEDVRRAAVQSLARGWKDDPETLPLLKGRVRFDEDGLVRVAAVSALAQDWNVDPEILPFLKDLVQNDEDEFVRSEAVTALARRWKEDPEILSFLKECACEDEDFGVRLASIDALARGWMDDLEILSFLKDRAREDEDSDVRGHIIEELARKWKNDTEILLWLKDCASKDEDGGVRMAAVVAVIQNWKDESGILTWLSECAINDDDDDKRYVAVIFLARDWKNDPKTLPFLKDRVSKDKDGDVRSAALESLVWGWNDDPETLPWIKNHARNDMHEDVRCVAIRVLVQGWKDDPDTLPWIKDRTCNDKHVEVRCAAVEALARGWKDDPDTLPLLKDRAHNDEHKNVRREALEALARGWKDDPETLRLLKDRASNDENGDVRGAAVKALSRRWKDDPEILLLFKDHARNHEDWTVRSAAVEALAQGWKDDPETLPLLKDRTYNDEDGDVRGAAIRALAQGWKDDPETLPLLKDRAYNDEDEKVRHAAVATLAMGWKSDPETLSLLKDCARNDEDWKVRRAAVAALERNWKDDPKVKELLNQCTRVGTNDVRHPTS